MSVAVVGGGPAGLLFAALLRERRPDVAVTLYERNPPDATYGFGVVFSASTLRRIAARDARLGDELARASTHWDRMELRVGEERRSCGGLGFSAIARRRLLDLLQERARSSGAELRFSTEADVDALARDHDLLIGADGVGSAARGGHDTKMRADFELATAKYIWFGAAKAFEHMTFLFEQTEVGWFAVHAYPYDEHLSTFVVECDPATWRRAGFDRFDSSAPPGVSDEATRLAMQKLFAVHLDGAELLANNSRWLSFRTLRVQHWFDENAVIVGDAAHTAHFSVGSGTTMALEDAIVLAEEVARVRSSRQLTGALTEYELTRRPSVARIQDAATPSRSWWERFATYVARLDLDTLCIHFLTRSGRVSARRLADGDPDFFVAATGGDIEAVSERTWNTGPGRARSPLAVIVSAGETIGDPDEHVGIVISREGNARVHRSDGSQETLSCGWVTAPDRPELVESLLAADRLPLGADLLVVERGFDDLDARTAQIVLCETLRLEHGKAVLLVDDTADRDTVVTLLLASRADGVAIPLAGASQLARPVARSAEALR